MKVISYRELSRRTTQVLEDVQSEPVLVTSRGVPVAVLRRPLPAELEQLSAELLGVVGGGGGSTRGGGRRPG